MFHICTHGSCDNIYRTFAAQTKQTLGMEKEGGYEIPSEVQELLLISSYWERVTFLEVHEP